MLCEMLFVSPSAPRNAKAILKWGENHERQKIVVTNRLQHMYLFNAPSQWMFVTDITHERRNTE